MFRLGYALLPTQKDTSRAQYAYARNLPVSAEMA
jgi:hypothetical protein